MRVQVIDDSGKVIWASNEIHVESTHDPLWRGAFDPYLIDFHSILNIISIAKDQARKDELHLVCMHINRLDNSNLKV